MKPFVYFILILGFVNGIGQSHPVLENYLQGMEAAGFSGVVLVMSSDSVVHNGGYGFYDRENSSKFQSNTPLFIASVTKIFISALIKQLVSIEKMSYSDPIGKYIKNVPKDKRGITIQHLLSHTSGLTLGSHPQTSNKTDKEFIDELMSSPLEFVPGSRVSYSNEGYSLLGHLAGVATGMSYPNCIRKYLFEPAGMKTAGVVTEVDKYATDELPHGYLGTIRQGNVLLVDWQPLHFTVKAGIIASIDDFIQFERALRNGLLSDKAMDDWVNSENTGLWSWFSQSRNTLVLGHDGYAMPFGFNSMYNRFVEDDLMIFAFSNEGTNSWAEQIAYDVGNILYGTSNVLLPPTGLYERNKSVKKLRLNNIRLDVYYENSTAFVDMDNQKEINEALKVGEIKTMEYDDLNEQTNKLLKAVIDGKSESLEFINDEQQERFHKEMKLYQDKFGSLKSFSLHYSFLNPIAPQEVNAVHTYVTFVFDQQSITGKIDWENGKFSGFSDIAILSAGGTGWPLPFKRIPLVSFSEKRMCSYLPTYGQTVFWIVED